MDSETRNPDFSEELNTLLAASVDGFTLVDSNARIIEANESFCRLTGYRREELLTMHVWEIDTIDTTEEVAERIETIMRYGSLRFESKHTRKDGSVIDVEVSATYLPLQGGLIISFARDITQQKLVEKALGRSEELYRNIVESQSYFVDRYLPGGILTYVNPALARFAGLEAGYLLGKSFYPFIHGDDRNEVVRKIESICIGNPTVETESRIVLPDGRILWNRWTHSGIFDEQGNLVEYQSVGMDITERMQAEMKLRSSEEKFSTAFRLTPDAININRLSDGMYLEINDGFTETCGFTAEDVIGKTSLELNIWADPEERDHLVTELKERGAVNNLEARFRCKNGSVITGLMSARTIEFLGEPCILSVSRDISERKKIEESLFRSEQSLRTIIDASPIPLALNDEQGNITYLNRAFEQSIGYSVSDIANIKEWWPRAYPDEQYRQSVIDIWNRHLEEATRTGQPFVPMEIDVVCKDSSVRSFMCSATPLGETLSGSLLVIFFDITERKKSEHEKILLEQQFQQAQRLESLGVLAGGIAHDFNNLLTIIIGNCSLAMRRPQHSEDHIQQIKKAADRAAELCEQMLSYAGKNQIILKIVSIADLVKDMVAMLKSSISQNAVIHLNIPDNIPAIKTDESQIRQIIMNLLINSSEAIGEQQGDIIISLTRTAISSKKPKSDYLGNTIYPGDYLCLEVTDNGCGMNDETLRHIFEPFYTTKFTGRGLGMSAVLGIIKAHSGALQLYSESGMGTTFKVYLPIQDDEYSKDEAPQGIATTIEAWKGNDTILLVEDEEQVASIAKEMLEELGFAVIVACNGAEALEHYNANAAKIVLVVTDIGMPVMDGYALCRELKTQNPNLPIIISSGFHHVAVSSRIDPDNIAGFISKPYNFTKMREVVKEVVETMKPRQAGRIDRATPV
ncbi:MAG: PAS domain S-box protein [Desulfuromonadaceae bacterium]|nr:PAS domain S-box protein [Desulfuromonadaceae bacterium]